MSNFTEYELVVLIKHQINQMQREAIKDPGNMSLTYIHQRCADILNYIKKIEEKSNDN